MTSNIRGNVAYSDGLRKVIDRRRFLALCGGAATTLVIASCTDKDAEPEVEQVTIDENQIPAPAVSPFTAKLDASI